jgi:hypothetical protein
LYQVARLQIRTISLRKEQHHSPSPVRWAVARLGQISPARAKVRHNDRLAVHPIVQSKYEEIAALCREFGVRRLDISGSAVTDNFDVDRSDVDVLVETEPARLTHSEYFALQTGLQRIVGREVDILDIGARRNPNLRAEVMATPEALYAA